MFQFTLSITWQTALILLSFNCMNFSCLSFLLDIASLSRGGGGGGGGGEGYTQFRTTLKSTKTKQFEVFRTPFMTLSNLLAQKFLQNDSCKLWLSENYRIDFAFLKWIQI